MTSEEFRTQFADMSGLSIEQQAELHLEPVRCRCSPECTEWMMAIIPEVKHG